MRRIDGILERVQSPIQKIFLTLRTQHPGDLSVFAELLFVLA